MRRALSILLVLCFGLGPLTSTLQAGDDLRLPPCCRRNGAHHCAMADAMMARMAQAATDRKPAFTAPSHCPFYPTGLHATVQHDQAMAVMAASAPLLHAQERVLTGNAVVACKDSLRTLRGRSPPTPAVC